jgi:hypothetical protein
VIQEKFRRFKTSGTRDNGFSTEADASPSITSGAVVAPFMLENCRMQIVDCRLFPHRGGQSAI